MTNTEMQAAGLAPPPSDFEQSDAGQRYVADQVAERERRGAQCGLNSDEVEWADKQGIALDRYASMRDVRTIDDFEAARDALAVEEKARAQAEFDEAVVRARKEVTT